MSTSPNFRSTLLCDLYRAVVRIRPLAASLIVVEYRQSSGRPFPNCSPSLLPGSSNAAPGVDLPSSPGAFSQAIQDSLAEKTNRLPIRIIVSGRRTAIRVGRFTQVQPKSISDYLRFLPWLVALVDLPGNHTRRITQDVGNIWQKLGKFIQGKYGRIGNVRRRNRRQIA